MENADPLVMITRAALVRAQIPESDEERLAAEQQAERIRAYLPSNYSLAHDGRVTEIGQFASGYLIVGNDNAGWTLGEYVIPRLASGMIFAKEVAAPTTHYEPFAM